MEDERGVGGEGEFYKEHPHLSYLNNRLGALKSDMNDVLKTLNFARYIY